MRKIFACILTACGAMVASAIATVDINALSEYVYPNNGSTSASLNFMPDGLTYLQLSADGKTINQYETASGKLTATIFDVAKTRGDKHLDRINGYSVSPDGSLLIVYQEKEQIYRRTFRAAYYIFDIKRNTLRPLSTEHHMQQSPVVSPDSRMVAFMAADNNIYIHKVDYGSEVAVTTDGKVNSIINGVPDWTYEEEFATSRSMEFAPDNSALSYLKYNETNVPAFSFTMYEGACNPMKQYALYPGEFTYKYPVAGEPNSKVTLHSYDVETRKTKDITLPSTDIEYIPRIHYGPTADKLIVLTLNRDQNRLDFYSVNPRSTVATQIHQEKSNAWVTPECYENVSFEANSMVIFSNRTGWCNLYRLDYNGNDLGALTEGNYDITAYYGTAPDGSYYYQSAGDPINRLIFKVDGKKKAHKLITPREGWASATFSSACNYYVLNYSTSATPPVYTLVKTSDDKTVRTLEDNSAAAAKFASAPKREFFVFYLNGVALHGWMVKPNDFNPSKKYPCIISQYSGPGSQEVKNQWQIDWPQYYAQQGYIIACVDGLGTGARGREFEQCVYKNLGYYETESQTALLSHLMTLNYIDSKRIGIYGWSFGGYETLMAASSGAPFAAACAVAPVTSWRYYDTIYAERYMSTPQANPEGYEQSAPMNRVNKLTCPLLMMSGTADDNVHLSNTMEFAAKMISLNRWPQMLLFPNMNHSIYGCNTRAVVYARMLQFFNEELGK
ncbi:MAG: S9 family peptidase [Bacteroides sp.]|nr:S9 family peptidase [Bacteroides sp.]MCM1379389.1 S9 family peptidase [Bacteroides sp.]MCM1445249.1 S9 family peptidase [Prevotella sp.]